MLYKFYCAKCDENVTVEILMRDYDNAKGNQVCERCGGPLRRVIEWSGTAEGHGDGWYGRSDGGKTI